MNHDNDKSIYIKMTAAAVVIITLLLLFHAFQPLPILSLTALCAKAERIACNSAAAVL